LIGATTTTTGLKVESVLDTSHYQKGSALPRLRFTFPVYFQTASASAILLAKTMRGFGIALTQS
jgi:hypothetical protein